MSVSIDPKKGVRFRNIRRRGFLVIGSVVALEALFSFFLYLSLAERIFVVTPAGATAGVPELISYQGLLTDTSGNPLGGAGTVYCFRYSIYDSLSAGSQLWPAGTPSNSTTTVVDGIFSDQLGRTDSLSGLDFESTSTYYLQVQVNSVTSTCSGTWENLTPRQQITSDGWAQTSQAVYGNVLRTGTSTVQIGTAAGALAGNQTLLSLDVVNNSSSDMVGNSCSHNGTLWYDSAQTRALVCEAGVIQAISNGNTTVGALATNGNSPISSGTIVLSNSNGVTFGQNGSTITASVAIQGFTAQSWDPYPPILSTSAQIGQGNVQMWGASVAQYVSATAVRPLASVSLTSSSNSSYAAVISLGFGIYTRNSTSFGSVTTGSTAFQWSQTSNSLSSGAVSNVSNYTIMTGLRGLPIAMNINMTPGEYWFALWSRTSTTNANWFTASNIILSGLSNQFIGNMSVASNSSNQMLIGWGSYSVTTAGLPASFAQSAVYGASAPGNTRIPYVYFSDF